MLFHAFNTVGKYVKCILLISKAVELTLSCFTVISEYKQKLEENLKIDQAELQENKGIWETKVKEERDRAQKLISDAVMKYNSMFQHFKLLQVRNPQANETRWQN